MKFSVALQRRLAWINLPGAMLLALLQRTPVAPLAATAEELVTSTPVAAVLKSAVAAIASLGALHSLAGATTFVQSPANPVKGTVGTSLSVSFTFTGAPNTPEFFTIDSPLPPGMDTEPRRDSSGVVPSGTPTITGVPTQAGTFDVSVTGDDGLGDSGSATITFQIAAGVNTAPSFTTQPSSQTVNSGATVTFTAAAGGSPTPTLQWQKNNANISGATSGTLTLSNVTTADSATYTVVATNSVGTATSNAATLTVNAAAAAPAFTTQPVSQTVTAGATVTFTAAASGSPTPTLQWQKNSANISGATTGTLTLSNVTTADSATYTAVATNSAGTATSSAAVLTVNASSAPVAPAFTTQPAAQTISNNSTVVFSIVASGTPAPVYQWKLNGGVLAGATSATLVLGGATAANAGSYTCTATNTAGTATSNPAVLAISNDPNFGRLINLSILTSVTAANPFFTLGTVIGGPGTSGSKPLLVRAAGPTLAASFGITGALVDPKLDLFSGQTVLATNDNWGTPVGNASSGTTISNIMAQVGAFPFASPTSKDAAVYLPTMAPAPYTVQVSGISGGTGSVIAELYDSTAAASFTTSTPRLINVSVLKQIDAGSILTAGFVIDGTTAKTLLIRAIGPGLAQPNIGVGLASVLPDPKLTLFSGSTVIATNDNWGGDAQITSTGAIVGAFAITNPASKDAILLLTLPPGAGRAYTVQVSDAGGGSGLALIEVYEVP